LKVKKIETFMYYSVWRNLVIVRIETDEGIVGVGEATLRGKEVAIKACIDEHLAPELIGTSPFDISKMFDTYYTNDFWRGGPIFISALSGVEIAMWDIIGKYLKQPVYNFLGGKFKGNLRTYANGWYRGCCTSEEFVIAAKKAVSAGFTALKWDPLRVSPKRNNKKKNKKSSRLFGSTMVNDNYTHICRETNEKVRITNALENVYAIREAVGNDIDLCVDLHASLTYNGALRFVREAEKVDLMFVEEPMLPDNWNGYRKLAIKSNLPIAAGERAHARFGYKTLIKEQDVSIAQFDVTHMGGILESKLTASILEAEQILFAPHNSSGPVATMAAAMVDASCANFFIQEMMIEVLDLANSPIYSGFDWKNGSIIIDDKPGIGIEVNFEAIKKLEYKRKSQFIR